MGVGSMCLPNHWPDNVMEHTKPRDFTQEMESINRGLVIPLTINERRLSMIENPLFELLIL